MYVFLFLSDKFFSLRIKYILKSFFFLIIEIKSILQAVVKSKRNKNSSINKYQGNKQMSKMTEPNEKNRKIIAEFCFTKKDVFIPYWYMKA